MSETDLSIEDNEALTAFLMQSDEFAEVFSSSTLDQYRNMKKNKRENLVRLISQVRFRVSKPGRPSRR